MKYLILLTMLVIAIVGISMANRPAARKDDGLVTKGTGVAVVELFTSQGCSSCPAADKLLNEVIVTAANNNTPVIGLSWHVGYWNHLGWKDPYSSEKFTGRQKEYASKLQLSSLYTPQVIVNGHDQFVGSDASKLSSAIDAALKTRAAFTLEAYMSRDGENLNVTWSLDKSLGDQHLNIVLVEGEVSNYIPRGENKGLTITHHNVVRYLASSTSGQRGTSVVPLPNGKVLPGGTSVVMFVQDPTTMRISGAVKIGLKQ